MGCTILIMNNLFTYIIVSLFFLWLSFLSYKWIRTRLHSSFNIMIYGLFNTVISVQQYSIFFGDRLASYYPFEIDITNSIVLLSLLFLIAHIYLMIKPIRDK